MSRVLVLVVVAGVAFTMWSKKASLAYASMRFWIHSGYTQVVPVGVVVVSGVEGSFDM